MPNDYAEPTEAERAEAARQIVAEQKVVMYDTKEYTVEFYVTKLTQNKMIIPTYQRRFVWDEERQSKFIESVLIGLPIPFLFAMESPGTGYEIIDGAQRLGTLRRFKENELVLESLAKLDSLNGFKFKDLPSNQQDKFDNRTIRMVVLSENAEESTRLDMFERINTGSVTAEPAEVRKGAYAGPFYDTVVRMAKLPEFLAICPLSPGLAQRGEADELTLRFFIYSEKYLEFKHDVQQFLDGHTRQKNAELEKLANSGLESELASQVTKHETHFRRMIEFVSKHFPHGFAKAEGGKIAPRVRFEAISVGTHLALEEDHALVPVNVQSWLNGETFKKLTTTSASNSAPKLRSRIEYVRDRLLGR